MTTLSSSWIVDTFRANNLSGLDEMLNTHDREELLSHCNHSTLPSVTKLGNLKLVIWCIERLQLDPLLVDLNQDFFGELTAWGTAVADRDFDIIQYLSHQARTARDNVGGDDADKAYMYCLQSGVGPPMFWHSIRFDIVQWLIEFEPRLLKEPIRYSCELWTPLSLAVKQGDLEKAKWFFQAGCDPKQVYGDPPELLLLLNVYGGTVSLDVVKWLVKECGCDPQEKGSIGNWGAVVAAAHAGHLKVVQWLVTEGGSEPQLESDRSGRTAAICATYNAREEVLFWLANNGSNIFEERADDGSTCYHTAADYGHSEILRRVVELALKSEGKEIPTELTNTTLLPTTPIVNGNRRLNGDTPLMVAAGQGHLETVQMLTSVLCFSLQEIQEAVLVAAPSVWHLGDKHKEVVEHLLVEAWWRSLVVPAVIKAEVENCTITLPQWDILQEPLCSSCKLPKYGRSFGAQLHEVATPKIEENLKNTSWFGGGQKPTWTVPTHHLFSPLFRLKVGVALWCFNPHNTNCPLPPELIGAAVQFWDGNHSPRLQKLSELPINHAAEVLW